MVAIYPTGIKTFQNKADFTDIVDAGDINVAYDEIKAIEATLNTTPNTDTIDGNVVSWATVKDRITAVRKGVSNPFCNVVINNQLASFQSLPSFTGMTWDTHGIWDHGANLVCPRDGVYTFSYTIQWYSPTVFPPPFSTGGFVKSSLTVQGNTHPFMGVTGYYPAGWTVGIEQTASMTIPWIKGSSVFLTLNENVLPNIPYSASVSVVFERDAPTTNNL